MRCHCKASAWSRQCRRKARLTTNAAQHHKARPNTRLRGCHEKESTKPMSHHTRRCHESASNAKQGQMQTHSAARRGGARRRGRVEVLPRNHKCNHDALPQRNPNEGALALWGPGGRLPGDDIIESKRAHKASKSNRRQRRPPARETWPPEEPVRQRHAGTFHNKSTTHLLPPPITVPSCCRKARFSSQGQLRGRCIVLEDVEATKHCNAAVWWPSHPCHAPSHPSLCGALKGALAERAIWVPSVAGFEPR